MDAISWISWICLYSGCPYNLVKLIINASPLNAITTAYYVDIERYLLWLGVCIHGMMLLFLGYFLVCVEPFALNMIPFPSKLSRWIWDWMSGMQCINQYSQFAHLACSRGCSAIPRTQTCLPITTAILWNSWKLCEIRERSSCLLVLLVALMTTQ